MWTWSSIISSGKPPGKAATGGTVPSILETGFDGRTQVPTEFSLEYQWASRPAKLQSNVATRLSDHTPWVYIETDGGNGREAFWKTLQCQIKPQQTTPDSVRSISHPLQVLTMPPEGKTYTLPLSCNFMHNCQHPKPLAPGGKTLNLKKQNKGKTNLRLLSSPLEEKYFFPSGGNR